MPRKKKTSPDERRQQLTELVKTVDRLFSLAVQGSTADAETILDVVQTLTRGVCERWSTVLVLLPAPLESPITYDGSKFTNHAEVLYLQTLYMYHHLTELTCGHTDDTLIGYVDKTAVLEKWSEFAKHVLEPGQYLNAAEFARVAVIANEELAALK